MSVSCECCVLSGRGLCVGLITRPEECRPTKCGVSECDDESSITRKLCPTRDCWAMEGGMPCYCLRQVCTDPGRLNLVRWPLLFSAQLLQLPHPLPRHIQKCLLAHMHRAEGPRKDAGSQVTPELWVFHAEFASCHHSGAKNL
jgi:hypothetical protein